jgi:uncharacterized protein YecT (DUF1311 family)
MRSNHWFNLLLAVSALFCFSTSKAAEETDAILYESPKGGYRIQWVEDKEEAFVVSTKNPTERAALPDAAEERDPTECTVRFYGSPDEHWILYTESWRHHGEKAQELYQHASGVKFAAFKGKEWFTKAARNYAVKNGGFKMTDFLAKRSANVYEEHLRTQFRGWSADSSRLLFGIYGEADYRDEKHEPFYIYFNARTKTLEQTPYLRELNKTVAKLAPNYPADVVCAEPSDTLPSEAELKARFDMLNEKFNKVFAARAGAMSKEDADELRKMQQGWIKVRDEGLKTYLRFAPKGEEERRRLQFLADVTAARLEEIKQATKEELLM